MAKASLLLLFRTFGSCRTLLFIPLRLYTAEDQNEWKNDHSKGLLPVSPSRKIHTRCYADVLSGNYLSREPTENEKRDDE